ncbi:MAG: HlyD family efflux transporter periplasmic adaptor subunit [bacterium]|nr:HlyD family efflux transporter periplasmic adaptor subunit [bacterium]
MKGIKKKLQLSKKRMVIVSVVLVMAVSTTTVAVVYKVTAGQGQEATVAETTTVKAQQGNLTIGITGDGTTYVGSTDQTFDLSYGSSGLTLAVADVLVSSGDTVKKGDSLIQVSTDDVNNLISYYEAQIKTAKSTLSTAQLTYESNLAQAKYDYETNLKLKDTSLLQYEASIEELQNAVDEAKEAITNANDKISEYTKALANNTYYTKYNVAELKSTAKTKETALTKATESFNKLNKTYQSSKKTAESAIKKLEEQMKKAEESQKKLDQDYTKKLEAILNQVDSKNAAESYTLQGSSLTELKEAYQAKQKQEQETAKIEKELKDAEDKLNKLTKEYQEVSEAKQQANEEAQNATKKYEEALSNYNKAVEEANSNLKTLKNNASTLQANYDAAVINQEKETISLNKEYKISTLTYENAKSIYDAATKDLDADVTKAQETLDDLNANLSLLTGIKSDGIIKASEDGTIYSVSYEKEDEMVAGGAVVAYSKPETIDIDFTVSQDDIASISVGDTAYITVTGNRNQIEGKVSTIATSPTSSGSVSNVTYTVTVSVDNSEGNLAADSDASISIVKETLENVIYVPVNAVKTSGTTSTVERQKDDGSTEKVTVKTGKDNGTYIEITEGLSAGDVCVVER